MSSSSVQFKGVNAVVDAYTNREVAPWSLWQGKQFLFKYEGDSITEGATQLEATLEMLANSSNAIYTLKVYEELGKGGKIKANTPDDGSFNFKLNLDSQEVTQSQYGALRNMERLEQRLAGIEAALSNDDYEEPEPPKNRLGLIGEILNDPGLSALVVPLIQKAFGLNAPTPQPPAAQAMRPNVAIAGISEDAQLSAAIVTLKQADPRLSEHLDKLAKISTADPGTFQSLLAMLDQIQIEA